jgi:hypothetical protein
MARYATGKYAKAISDRSGLEYRYKDMRKEWNGLLVGKDEFERKHPQLGPFRKIHDPQTLKEARPNNNKIPVTVKFPIFSVVTLQYQRVPQAEGLLGTVTLGGDVVTPVSVTGVSASTGLGSVTVAGASTGSTFDSTSVTLDATNKTFDEA